MSKSKKEETAVALKEDTAVANYDGYADHAGKGSENVTSADLKIPFIKITQDRSAQKKSGLAEEGDIWNDVTKRAYKEYTFIPCYTTMDHVQWLPGGGGFVARHKAGDPEVIEAAKDKEHKLPNGNKVMQTFYIYGVEVNEDDSPGMIICIPFASTMIGPYRDFITSATTMLIEAGGQTINPPLYGNHVKMVGRKDKKFDSYNCDILPANGATFKESLLVPGSALFLAAVDCYNMAESSDMSAKTSYVDDTPKSSGAGSDTNASEDDEDEVLF